MEPAQIIAALLGSTVLGGIVAKALDWWKDARAGQLQERRAEVDRAIQAKDRETQRADDAEAAEEVQARRVRILEESLAVHRRVIIDASCLGPGYLPDYPSRKD